MIEPSYGFWGKVQLVVPKEWGLTADPNKHVFWIWWLSQFMVIEVRNNRWCPKYEVQLLIFINVSIVNLRIQPSYGFGGEALMVVPSVWDLTADLNKYVLSQFMVIDVGEQLMAPKVTCRCTSAT